MEKGIFYFENNRDMDDIQEEKKLITYKPAAEAIKTAILQGQYEASQGVTRVLLAICFCIGKYISQNTRKGFWGTGALETISLILRKELPGLRGYSANSLKNMRKFYESWQILDSNVSVATDNTDNSTIAIVDLQNKEDAQKNNSTIAIVESPNDKIDIHQSLCIPDSKDFPIDDFFRVPFTHHIRIIEGTDDISARYYYIHRTAEENLSARLLEKLIKDDAYGHRDTIPSNFKNAIPQTELARKAVMMFKDSYLLDFINVEQIGEREAIGCSDIQNNNRYARRTTQNPS